MLALDDVVCRYGSIEALHGISMEIEAGEFVCLIGANGAGKSTLLRAVSGLIKPARGTIRWDGEQIDGATPASTEQLGVTPDAVVLAKGAVVGATLGRADLTRYLHTGWHSNTFGGGKIFDVNFAHAVVDVVANERNPVFDGLSYPENCAVKGEYLRAALDRIAERLPGMLTGHEGRGLMHGVTVRRREAVLQEGWRRGLKLIGCGPGGELARVRLLFLADTLAREIDDFARVFEETLAAVEDG